MFRLLLLILALPTWASVHLEVEKVADMYYLYAINDASGHFRIKLFDDPDLGIKESVFNLEPNQKIKIFERNSSINPENVKWQDFVGVYVNDIDDFIYSRPSEGELIFESGMYRFKTGIGDPVRAARGGVLLALEARVVGGWTAYVEHSDLSIGEYKGVDFDEVPNPGLELKRGESWAKSAGRNFYFSLKTATPNVGTDNEGSLSSHLVKWENQNIISGNVENAESLPRSVVDSDGKAVSKKDTGDSQGRFVEDGVKENVVGDSGRAEVATGKVAGIGERPQATSSLAVSTPYRDTESSSIFSFLGVLLFLVGLVALIFWYSREPAKPTIKRVKPKPKVEPVKMRSKLITPVRTEDRIGGDDVRAKDSDHG